MGNCETLEDYQRSMERHYRQVDRRLAVLARLRTKKYMAQLRELMAEVGGEAVAFVRSTGKARKEKSEWPAIKWEWIHQYENGGYSGDSYAGYIYLEVKPGRFLQIHYSM